MPTAPLALVLFALRLLFGDFLGLTFMVIFVNYLCLQFSVVFWKVFRTGIKNKKKSFSNNTSKTVFFSLHSNIWRKVPQKQTAILSCGCINREDKKTKIKSSFQQTLFLWDFLGLILGNLLFRTILRLLIYCWFLEFLIF